MSFAILQPPRILFGRGTAMQAMALAQVFGPRGIVVHGAGWRRIAHLLPLAEGARIFDENSGLLSLTVTQEPRLDDLTLALNLARSHRPDWVLGIGGGSVLDMAKALAALIPAPQDPMVYLEAAGPGQPLTAPPLPFIAVPTTAGTGAEVTKNAVIGLPDLGRKVSLRDERMIARVAIVDPALTDHCPRPVTLASGLDAVTQVIEPYLSTKATPYSDAIARPAIAPGLAALRRLMQGEDPQARDALAWTSLCGGLALANAGLGAVHGLAGVIGGRTGAAHGAICGALLGPVLQMNRQITSGSAQARVDGVCTLIAGVLGGPADMAPLRLTEWARARGLPGLADQGLRRADHAAVAAAALKASAMTGNPVQPAIADLEAVLAAA